MSSEVWVCQECKSKDVYQEATQMLNLNDDDGFGGDLNYTDFFWCNSCDDECKVEQKSKLPLLTLEMQLPVNEKTMELHHT